MVWLKFKKVHTKLNSSDILIRTTFKNSLLKITFKTKKEPQIKDNNGILSLVPAPKMHFGLNLVKKVLRHL